MQEIIFLFFNLTHNNRTITAQTHLQVQAFNEGKFHLQWPNDNLCPNLTNRDFLTLKEDL